MSNNADDQFHKAITWEDWQILRTFFYKDSINKPPYDDEYTVDLLIKNKWILTDVVAAGKLDLTKLFIERAGDSISVNDADKNGWTGLHRAAYDSDIEQVKFFLKNNADPNSMCLASQTPLDCSYFDHHDENEDHGLLLEIMKLLIDAGAKAITTRDNVNYLQVESALVEGNLESVEFVLNLDIDLRAHYFNGDTVLHYLARNEHAGVFAKIHGRDYDVNARNNHGETPLYVAARDGIVVAVEFLLNEGTDVNAANNDNWTPLRIAAQYYEDLGDRCMECIKLLLQHGADIQVVATRNDSSTTIFDTILKYKDGEEMVVMYDLMLDYLAMQEANGTEIDKLVQNKISRNPDFKAYFDNCKEFLSLEIYESKTLFELLCCSEEKLVPLMRNLEFVYTINHVCNRLESSPVSYGNLLKKRFDKAKRTAALRDSAAVVICELMKIDYHGYSFIVDSILRYLGNQDLNNLINIQL